MKAQPYLHQVLLIIPGCVLKGILNGWKVGIVNNTHPTNSTLLTDKSSLSLSLNAGTGKSVLGKLIPLFLQNPPLTTLVNTSVSFNTLIVSSLNFPSANRTRIEGISDKFSWIGKEKNKF